MLGAFLRLSLSFSTSPSLALPEGSQTYQSAGIRGVAYTIVLYMYLHLFILCVTVPVSLCLSPFFICFFPLGGKTHLAKVAVLGSVWQGKHMVNSLWEKHLETGLVCWAK